jgi:WD40 repeat protein
MDTRAPLWFPGSIRFAISSELGIEIWDAPRAKLLRVIKPLADWKRVDSFGGPPVMEAQAISADGRYLAGKPCEIREPLTAIWDTATGKCLRVLKGEGHPVFSPDGQYLLLKNVVYKWRSDGAPAVLRLVPANESEQPVISGPWSPDGRRIYSSGAKYVQMYDAASGELVASHTIGGTQRKANYNDWLIWTTGGYYSAPDAGKARVRWKENGQLIPYGSARDKALRKKFYQPKKVAEVLTGGG